MKIKLPKEGTSLIVNNKNSDFILLIDGLNIYRQSGTSGSWIGNQYSGGSFPSLYHGVKFLFWDNQKGQIVCYGRVDYESSFAFGMTSSTWNSAINGLATELLDNSPFPALKVYNYH